MNYFETSYLTTPIFGAFGGAFAAKSHGNLAGVLGVVAGVLVALAVLAGLRWLVGVLAERFSVEAQNWHIWLGVLVYFLLPLALPVVAGELSWAMVQAVVRL